ncbi:20S proteasome subunit alpha 7 [Nannochloropsis gaditana CCMP526]|uniref:20S proteasome subunit alpha 7 n=1 Tax=Nannochloropsis gaditana (strain CCMP526) TaxID=1093141 RepID=UPI00029F74A2|nr:20S proteasome subunit alpha 7 [Nannochloropsis gaditana CCMP526]EKU20482.1 20S proteasome subunit alpha 7 [Nannochloropsis gaditana CCMP526]|eukprot:XP_005855873.1 20S proteasome subunit alpha 7 [Nannochloropsis gaditana CCMP526]
MSSTGAGYDVSPTTFSPDGRLFQVEYAGKAVENSGTAIGLKCKDGVILAVENLMLSKLLVSNSNRRTYNVGSHISIAVAGLVSDGRQVVNRAREEAENYKDNYGSDMPPTILADRLAQFVHYFTLNYSLRPFGASVLIAGHDAFTDSIELHVIEPSGVAYKFFGAALGKGRQGAKTEIEKLKLTETTCDDAVKEMAKILHKLHDESKDKPFELEMAWVTAANGYKAQRVPRDIVAAAEKWAKEAIEAEDMDESDEEEGGTAP